MTRTLRGLLCLPLLLGAVAVWPGDADAARSAHLTARVDGTPVAVAADGSRNRVYVATIGPNAIRILDGATRTILDSILLPPTSRIVDLAVYERVNRIYAIDAGENELLVINGAARTVREVLPLDTGAQSVAVDEARGFVYVTTARAAPASGELTQVAHTRRIVDGRIVERHVVRRTRELNSRIRGVAASPDFGEVVVVSASPVRRLQRFGADDLSLLATTTFPLASSPVSVAVHHEFGTMYVADVGVDRMRIVTRTGFQFDPRVTGADPVDVAVNQESERVYVATRGPDAVTVFRREGSLDEVVTVLDRPTSLAVDLANHRVFVATLGSTRVSVLARFDPAVHGFAFANDWPLGARVTIPSLGVDYDIGSPYGLCGGMVFGALDAFNAGARAPATATRPAIGTPLYTYLFGRLVDSLTANFGSVFARYLEWQARPIEDVLDPFGNVRIRGVRTLSDEALTAARPMLDVGRPVPLGLVYVDATRPPWENHQVLAIGHATNSDGERVVEIYDPNGPGASRFLQTERLFVSEDLDGDDPVLRADGSPRTYRGFFPTRYTAERPVWLP